MLGGFSMTDLQPGRELDALVAEKVMGIPTEWLGTYVGDEEIPLPAYSTDWRAAGLVLEKLGIDIELKREVDYFSEWSCWLGDEDEGREVGYGKTGPHAISLAALEAVGASVET
jgi:hypothetical protein